MRKSKFWISIFIILLIFFNITACSNNNNEQDKIKEKVSSELEFLDSQILNMLNNLNNISFRNYEVVTQEISKGSQSDSSSQGGGSKESSESDQSSDSNQKVDSSKMITKGILTNSYEPKWDDIKNTIEKLYSSWATIIIDLYSININNYDILNFSNDLEQAIINIKNEDKQASLTTLAKLYSYIPKYSESYSPNQQVTNIYYTKSNIINAYALVEQDNWTAINTSISEANRYYEYIVNDSNIIQEKQAKISKSYTLLKELQNCLDLKDKEVFYIKYKPIMQELDEL